MVSNKECCNAWLKLGGDQVRYLPLHWSLGDEFRHCFSTLTYLGLFPKQLSSIADLHCMLWKADLLQATQVREDKGDRGGIPHIHPIP